MSNFDVVEAYERIVREVEIDDHDGDIRRAIERELRAAMLAGRREGLKQTAAMVEAQFAAGDGYGMLETQARIIANDIRNLPDP